MPANKIRSRAWPAPTCNPFLSFCNVGLWLGHNLLRKSACAAIWSCCFTSWDCGYGITCCAS